jgi:hypothetical protein
MTTKFNFRDRGRNVEHRSRELERKDAEVNIIVFGRRKQQEAGNNWTMVSFVRFTHLLTG